MLRAAEDELDLPNWHVHGKVIEMKEKTMPATSFYRFWSKKKK